MDTSTMLSLDMCYSGVPFCNINMGCVDPVYQGMPFYGYTLGGITFFSKLGVSSTKSIGVLDSTKVSKVIGVVVG